MKSIRVYKFKIDLTHPVYKEDTCIEYVASDSYEEAVKYIKENMKKAGWTVKNIIEREFVVWDIRE